MEPDYNLEGKLGTRAQVISWGRAVILRSILNELKEAA